MEKDLAFQEKTVSLPKIKKNDSLSTIDLHEENHQDSIREGGQTLNVDDDCQIVKPSKRKLK